jgi:tetratricopeptide (TPR) repeat protein
MNDNSATREGSATPSSSSPAPGEGRCAIRPVPNFLRLLSRRPQLAVLWFVLVLLGTGTAIIFLGAEYHLRAAHQALERHELDEAQHHLDLYLKVHFRSAAGHLLAAQTARRREAYDEAENHLAAYLRLEGMTEAAALERLLLTAQQGDLADMEELLKARTSPSDPEAVLVLEALAKGYLNRCWEQDALVCLNKLLERQPGNPRALLMRARVWENRARKGETERETDALHDYEKAVELNPVFDARLGLAGALFRVGRTWEALMEYERLRQVQAANPEVLLGLARCLYSLHEVDEARRLLDALLEQQPDHAAALLERGRLAFHAGELGEAEKWLSRAAAVASLYDCEPHRCLYQCLQVEHKDEEARQCFDRLRDKEESVLRVNRRILQVNREPHDVALRYEIALELLRLGREEEGVAALFLVLEQEPRHGPAHAALADYFERTGQPARAARHRRASGQRADANPETPVRQ